LLKEFIGNMRGRLLVGLLGFGGLSLLAAGLSVSCAPDTSAPTLQQRSITPTATEPIPQAVALLPTGIYVEPFRDQACLDCHTNQEKLVELAVPPPEKETLSEGPG
jgi:hypothetical protein